MVNVMSKNGLGLKTLAGHSAVRLAIFVNARETSMASELSKWIIRFTDLDTFDQLGRVMLMMNLFDKRLNILSNMAEGLKKCAICIAFARIKDASKGCPNNDVLK